MQFWSAEDHISYGIEPRKCRHFFCFLLESIEKECILYILFFFLLCTSDPIRWYNTNDNSNNKKNCIWICRHAVIYHTIMIELVIHCSVTMFISSALGTYNVLVFQLTIFFIFASAKCLWFLLLFMYKRECGVFVPSSGIWYSQNKKRRKKNRGKKSEEQ